MNATILAAFIAGPRIVVAMCAFGLAVFLIGVLAAKNDVAGAHGLEKVVALRNLCFAIPLAVFGAEHLFGSQALLPAVPSYMPWRMFIVYFVGCALVAASLSIASKVGVRWSGFLFGLMMVLFVAMIHFPGALRQPHNRILWTIVFRETSFGGAGWIIAGTAMRGSGSGKKTLIGVGRVMVSMTLIIFGVEHFLHATGLPGVPLAKQIPAWVPGREFIDYLTGAALLITAGSVMLGRKTRTVATCLGSWILLTVLLIYGPVLVVALADPGLAVKVEGINYFADTLLFVGVILALASAASQSRVAEPAGVPRAVGTTLSPTGTGPASI